MVVDCTAHVRIRQPKLLFRLSEAIPSNLVNVSRDGERVVIVGRTRHPSAITMFTVRASCRGGKPRSRRVSLTRREAGGGGEGRPGDGER
jgi:hypothetical protein